jgi:hypothetical protein
LFAKVLVAAKLTESYFETAGAAEADAGGRAEAAAEAAADPEAAGRAARAGWSR